MLQSVSYRQQSNLDGGVNWESALSYHVTDYCDGAILFYQALFLQ